jgi:nucleoside-triphosphatase THEP1
MNSQSLNGAFTNAYNNFDSRPLFGETMRRFYIDDFTKEAVKSIKTTIQISAKFRKILVIGHRGCGKSTILNKVAEELNDIFHIVSFSVPTVLNMNDVETIDILISIYLQLLNSMNDQRIPIPLLTRFNDMMESVKKRLELTETGISLLKIITFKIKVENESRDILRKEFRNQVDSLNRGISECIESIRDYYNKQQKTKEVLIIIDDLEKLEVKFAEQLFFKDSHLLTLPEAKIIYTFPLETYYCEDFNTYRDQYEDQFISLVVVNEQKNQQVGIEQLAKLVLQRIDQQYITEEALTEIILMSGGLLRDLINLMQDACKKAILNESSQIDIGIAEQVINEMANHYKRLFDYPNYREKVEKIKDHSARNEVQTKDLVYLLRYLFILEYRLNGDLWYEVHPCLKRVLNNG